MFAGAYDGLSLAGQYAGRVSDSIWLRISNFHYVKTEQKLSPICVKFNCDVVTPFQQFLCIVVFNLSCTVHRVALYVFRFIFNTYRQIISVSFIYTPHWLLYHFAAPAIC